MNDYTEARQHLNLSQAAYDVLDSDRYEFLAKPSLAGIVNQVLRCYMDASDASIDRALSKYRESLCETLAGIPEGAVKKAVVEALTERRRRELRGSAGAHPREKAFKLRLDEDVFNAMQDWRDDGDDYSGRPGNFLKAVIEEYAEKPLLERESILLRDRIEKLRYYIDSNQLIVITLKDHGQKARKPQRYEVRPYSVVHDPGFNYHYLTGFSRRAGTDDPETPASFRISRIEDNIRPSRARSGKITAEQKREMEKKLRNEGVQFLLGRSETIRVKLTAYGKRMYETQAHLRPPFVERKKCEDGSWSYEFNCTQTQAEYYFFKFGTDAHVESPAALQARFRRKYEAAAASYTIPK